MNILFNNILIFGGIILFSSIESFAQRDITNLKINYEKNEFNKISRIHFKVNSETKNFDVYKNNPYAKLNYRIKEIKKGNPVYTVENTSLKAILPNYEPKYYEEKNIGEVKIIDIYSYSNVKSSNNNNYQIIYYQLNAYRDGGEIAGINSTLLILDSTSTVIREYKDINVNTKEVAITDDGKFLLLTYGYESESGTFMKYGFRIYDLVKNKIEIECSDENQYVGLIKGNLFILGYDYKNDSNQTLTKIIVYDLYKKKKYTRIFNDSEQDIIEINSEGYIIKLNTERKLLKFKDEFKNENI